PNRTPCYHIFGWVALAPDITATILTRGSTPVDYAPVGVLDCDSKLACRLVIHVDPRREWVTVNGGEYAEGGYWRDIPATLKPNDLYLRAAADSTSKTLSPRKEQSYLGIIAAMRALLRDKDGGAFPSEAKIIDQLVDRYKTVDGVSKRKLEDVFADATRTAGDLTRPK